MSEFKKGDRVLGSNPYFSNEPGTIIEIVDEETCTVEFDIFQKYQPLTFQYSNLRKIND